MSKISLKNLCYRIGDGLHGTPTYDSKSKIYFINGNNLKNGKLEITENTNSVSNEEYKKNFIELNENSLLISINGTLGSMAFYNNERVMLGKSAAYLNFKNGINRFYYYYFKLKEIQEHFHNVATGSTIKNLSLKSIQELEVPVPKEEVWQKIANILSTLDAKIELNNRINKELEAMAKTLYDYWFVQFDFPDENSKPYKSSGGKMVYNKELKREIPEGWEVKKLEDIEKNIITGKTPPKENEEFFNGEVPFITIGDIRGNMFIVETEETLSASGADYQKNKYINKGAICVSCIASPGLVGFAIKPSQTNQQINAIECEREENRYYLYFAIKDFFLASKAKTGNTFPNMNKGDFSSLDFFYPNNHILEEFKKTAKPIFEKIFNNSLQTQKLTTLRDFLLPMLMNGQVSVK